MATICARPPRCAWRGCTIPAMPDGGTARRVDPRAAGWALALAVLAGAAPLAPEFYELRYISSEPGSCDQLDRLPSLVGGWVLAAVALGVGVLSATLRTRQPRVLALLPLAPVVPALGVLPGPALDVGPSECTLTLPLGVALLCGLAVGAAAYVLARRGRLDEPPTSSARAAGGHSIDPWPPA